MIVRYNPNVLHGFKSNTLHTVVRGYIREIEKVADGYWVTYYKGAAK